MTDVVMRSRETLSDEEHEALARHFYAVEWHVCQMLDILNGRVKVKWLDMLLKNSNSRWAKSLRSALDDLYLSTHDLPSPYYGNGSNGAMRCPAPALALVKRS